MSLYLLPHTFLLLPLSSFIPCHFPCLTFPFSPLLPYPSSLYRHSPSHPPYLLLLYHLTILLLFIDLPLLILHTFPFTFTLLPLYTFPFFYSLQASHTSTIYLLLSSLYLLILLYVPNSSWLFFIYILPSLRSSFSFSFFSFLNLFTSPLLSLSYLSFIQAYEIITASIILYHIYTLHPQLTNFPLLVSPQFPLHLPFPSLTLTDPHPNSGLQHITFSISIVPPPPLSPCTVRTAECLPHPIRPPRHVSFSCLQIWRI